LRLCGGPRCCNENQSKQDAGKNARGIALRPDPWTVHDPSKDEGRLADKPGNIREVALLARLLPIGERIHHRQLLIKDLAMLQVLAVEGVTAGKQRRCDDERVPM
jgi:hypothetical protein